MTKAAAFVDVVAAAAVVVLPLPPIGRRLPQEEEQHLPPSPNDAIR